MRRFYKPRNSLLAVGIALAIGLFFGWKLLFPQGGVDTDYVLYEVAYGDLPIVITERGNLESQQATTIRCEVENVSSSRNGQNGTTIIFIVPNGSPVKEGDLLVELDSSPIRELFDQQTITFERQRAEQIQSNAQYNNQITQNLISIADADLQVQLAQLELDMFADTEKGTHKLNVDDIRRQIDETNNEILESQSVLELRRNELEGVRTLFELGYKGKSDYNERQLSYLQAEGRLAAALNRLSNQQAMLDNLEGYEKEMSRLTLEGKLANMQRAREQVEVDNLSNLTQAEAALQAANRALEKEEERLANLEQQMENCKIYAPHDGMVVYERDRDFTIEEGAIVRERQRLLSLPNLSMMQVQTSVHESVLDQVTAGQRVEIRVDAFTNESYIGTVDSVAVVPSSSGWFGGDVKTYQTLIKINGEVQQLKPGMTAVVEIQVADLKSVISVPVQAIIQENRDSWCYVSTPSGPEMRTVTLGQTNDRFVEILSGLDVGEMVILNPYDLLEQQDSGEIEPEQSDDQPSTENEDRYVAKRGSESAG